jgi:hypothetical protein
MESESFGKGAWPAALAASLAILTALFIWQPQTRPTGLLRDFNAFYCAGRALANGSDPYRAEPLGSCERAVKPPFASGIAGLAVPAPLPPYALAPFRALAMLPYPAAAALWLLFLVGAVALAVAATHRATDLPLSGLIAGFALGDGYASLCLGQLAPVAVAAITVATACAQRHRYRAAAFAAALAMVEPHVALPACLALFLWRPAARVPLAAAALALLALSIATGGMATNLEYVRQVVAAHGLSEIANEKQLSLTYLVHRFGAGDAQALRIGEMWYAAMLIAGALAAARLARRFNSDGLIAAVPPAMALVGGPFVHIAQIPAALPAAFLLYANAPRLRVPFALSIVALAIPWMQFVSLGTIFPLLAGACAGVLVWRLLGVRPPFAVVSGLAALCFAAAPTFLVSTRVPAAQRLLVAAYDPRALAEASWGAYVQAVATWNLPAYDLARLPTLTGIVTLAFGAAALAFGRRAIGAGAPSPYVEKGTWPLRESA